jgi:hypothetical protein
MARLMQMPAEATTQSAEALMTHHDASRPLHKSRVHVVQQENSNGFQRQNCQSGPSRPDQPSSDFLKCLALIDQFPTSH